MARESGGKMLSAANASGVMGTRSAAPMRRSAMGANLKYNLDSAFGRPRDIDSLMIREFCYRSGSAMGAINAVLANCWKTNPSIRISVGDMHPREDRVNRHFERINLWRSFIIADGYSMLGSFSALVLRFADGRPLSEPVGRLPNTPAALVEAVPVCDLDLIPQWTTDEKGHAAAEPESYVYTFRNDQGTPVDSIELHPERIVILSPTGKLDCRPVMEPAFDALVDLEKVRGGGAESIIKDSRMLVHFNIDGKSELAKGVGGISRQSPGQAQGSAAENVAENMGAQMDAVNSSFENFWLSKGIDSSVFATKVRGVGDAGWQVRLDIAAAVGAPIRILYGSQSGERSTSEDRKIWADAGDARRRRQLIPAINKVLERMRMNGALIGDWQVRWNPLNEDTHEERMSESEIMRRHNADARAAGAPAPFLTNEVRARHGLAPFTEEQISEENALIESFPKPEPPVTMPEPGASGGTQQGS